MPLTTNIIGAMRHRSPEGEQGDSSNHASPKREETTSSAEMNEVSTPAAEKGDDALHVEEKRQDPEAAINVAETSIEDSPYADVRAAVRNTDDESEVANTMRAWVLGMTSVTIAGGLNMFLSMRSPAISIPSIMVQLLAYPIGCFWAKVVPVKEFNTFGLRWTSNPGPFTIKEHAVITIMANVSINYAYSTDALLALKGKPFFNIDMGWGFQLLLTLSSQLIGISLSGLCRRFLVWPASMIWPGNFSNTGLFYALHDKSKSDPSETNGWNISRYRWFLYIMVGSFIWYWMPGVVWQGLSVFCFVTWIKPNDVVLNQLFGGFTGLALIPITFDWTYISGYLQSPLLSPPQAHMNVLLGLGIFVIITSIGITYTGAWYAEYLPINTSSLFDNTQQFFNVSRVIGDNFNFDEAKYKTYSPVFLAPTFALNYGLSFAALTAVVVHIILFHGKEIVYRYKTARNQEADVHLKMMLKYKECPEWWYGLLFLICLGMGLAASEAYPSQLPWWAFFVANIIAAIFIVPTSMILAITNIQLSLNVLTPFLGGYMLPGRAIGVMVFKIFGTATLGQAQKFSQDLKLAHYMKVAVMNWTLGNVDQVCTTDQPAHFTCPNGKTFFSSSIVWGVIGPGRMFGPGSIYWTVHLFWLIGGCLPILFWVLKRMFPRSPARVLNAPVLLGAMGWLPPATPLNFSTWAIVGLTFNYWIKNRWWGWWRTYNYVTSAALDSGLIFSTVIIFLAITLPEVPLPDWWGNTVPLKTLDNQYTAYLKKVPQGGTFGPKAW